MREKKMKKKRLKQKKIVVLSCFKFCWDSFLILWKTPSFSPHCCWNYYLLLYILLREKSGRGNHISFQATPICWFYDARCWKKKKKISALRSYSHRLFQSSASQHKNKQTNKNHNVEKKKTKTVFKTAIVIAVKQIMKIRKIDWNLLTRKKTKTKTKQEQEKTKQTTRVSPLFSSSSNLAMMMNASKKTVIIITDIIIPK